MAVTVATFALDLLLDARSIVTLYVAGPLLAAVRAGRRETAAIGALAVVLAALQLAIDADTSVATAVVRVGIVTVLSAIAVWTAWQRERQETAEAARQVLRARLEEAFGLLDVIYAHAPVGLAIFDRELRYVRVNDRMAEIDGVPPDDHAGHTLAELLPGFPAEVTSDLRRVLERAEPIMEVHVTASTPERPGEQREFLASYWPVRQEDDTEPTGVGVVMVEVTERRAAQRELRAQTDRYEALLLALSEAGQGLVVLDEDGGCVFANAAFEQLSGYPFPELAAMDSVLSLVLPDQREDARRRARLRIHEGLVDGEYTLSMRRRDGRRVELEVVGVPLHVEERHRLVVIVRDITERRRVEVERERLLARSALMAEASELFDQTLDEAATLERVARLCVRDLASTCIVVLGEGPRAVRRVAAAARDPEVERRLVELQLRYPFEDDPEHVVFEVLRTGEPRVVEEIRDEAIERVAVDERHGGLLRDVATRAALIVPLRARGSVRGVLALGFAELAEDQRDDLLGTFEDLGRRAALALDTARLYQERTSIARTLQRSLLPPALPEVPGLDIAARYHAAGEGTEVGGDFYDCFPVGDGEWAAVIGDVCGKGAEAAAVTALARHTARAAATHDPRPEGVLLELNAAIMRHSTDYRFATVLYVRLRPCESGVDVSVATGGHPLPLLLRADGRVETVGRPGTLLGVVEDPDVGVAELRLCAGDALVLFTDGVIEASPLDGALGPERLARLLGHWAGHGATQIATGLQDRVLELQGGRPRDDVAVVVLRSAPGPSRSFDRLVQGVAARS